MKHGLPDFSAARVLVVGDLMLDRYWQGPTSRISPEAPVPIVKVEGEERRPGGAGNVALNVAALGGRATVLGLTGEDEAAARLRALLEQSSIDCRFVAVPGSATVSKLRVVSRHQQLVRLDFEDGFVDYDHDALQRAFEGALPDAAVVVFSDYGKGALRRIQPMIEAARRAGKAVLVDPKGADFERYRGATLITPNFTEFEAVAGLCASEDTLTGRGETLRDALGLEALLVTRSEKGMALFESGEKPLFLPTHAKEVFDVTGAGDTVIAVLGAAVAAGAELGAATALANLAAGIVVGRLGTAAVTVQELHAATLEHEPLARGMMAEPRLADLVAKARASGERIVMTNGCFDILHAGHVGYLAQAAELGDRLIVAVNDDDSVRRLKGEGRPVNPLDARMKVLSALACVDWVIPFAEDTPERLICALRPDVLVKGGDYRPEDIAGGDCVRRNGGEVVVLDTIEGHSTSAMIDNIRNSGSGA